MTNAGNDNQGFWEMDKIWWEVAGWGRSRRVIDQQEPLIKANDMAEIRKPLNVAHFVGFINGGKGLCGLLKLT